MNEPARICIVTPGALGSNPRVVKEADALHSAGFEVTTISTRTLARLDQHDEAVLQSRRWTSERLDLRNRWFWWLKRASQIGARAAYQTAALPAWAERAHSPFTPPLKSRAARNTADLYIAHYVAALPAAARAAARHGAAYAFDAEDFHPGDLPDTPEHALEKDLIRAIEARYLPGAAYVSAASPMIAEAYAETYGIARPVVVLNVFPKANAPAGPTRRGSARPGPSLYWFSQTIGPGRGLETALKAIAQAASRPHLYLRGTPATGYEAYLRDLAEQDGTASRLHILKPAPPDDLERLGAAFDLGFIGEVEATHNRRIALTNKLFSYILGGVPCLASDIPAHRRIAPELGEAMTLFPASDAKALAGLLDRFLYNADRLAAARRHAWELGQNRFNWDQQKVELLETIAGVNTC